MSRRIFLLVDAHALIYRAYYALPNLTDPQGHLVNAAYGFTRMFLTAINHFEPEYSAVCFDHKGETLRKKQYEAYKAQRAKMPDDLIPQIALVKDLVDALNVPRFELEGYEADDLIGTINRQVEHLDNSLLTEIVTGDQDMFQLVDNDTHIWMPARGRQQGDMEYDQTLVEKKMQISPNQVVDFKALSGDASDNIPGIKGIGKKTATKLINRFENLEKIYEFLEKNPEGDDLIKGALLKRLKEGKESAFLSQDLATISTEVNIDFVLEACRVTAYDKTKTIQLLNKLGFKSLIKLLPTDAFENSVQEALF
jgi:DNA polymerase-1